MAGLPLLVSGETGRLVLDLSAIPLSAARFIRSLADGSAFSFRSGYTSWDFRELGPRFLLLSFAYTALPGAVGIGLGSFAGAAYRSRRASLADRLAGLALATPDFLLIFLAQLGATWLAEASGLAIRLSGTAGRLAPLPFALMAFFPFFLAYRAAAEASRRAEGEAFIAYARAKGMPERIVLRRHLGAAIVPAIEAELPLIIASMQGSLFFVEKAFSLPGMARLLYDSAFAGRRKVVMRAVYQYDHVVLSLLGLSLSCIAVYCALRLSLALARKALTRE
jgi:ABC-type dipeptide/oligopeptide/nickel transport system permease component